jgi:ABC-2 type transport system permease protein
MSRREYAALLALFVHGWGRAALERTTTIGRITLLVLILFIFWAMWSATPLRELGANGPTVEQMFWYLAATETVAMSVGYPYRIIEADIHSGEIATAFIRPVDYALATLAGWFGEMTYRFIAVATAAFLCGVLATRTVPFDAATGALLLIALWIGAAMLLVSQLCVGLLATWMKSAAPAFWIWQKLFFVLGGLMIPLTLYPSWLEAIAFATPFPAMLFLPASLVLDTSVSHAASVFVGQLFWSGVLVAIAAFMYARMSAHVTVHGA